MLCQCAQVKASLVLTQEEMNTHREEKTLVCWGTRKGGTQGIEFIHTVVFKNQKYQIQDLVIKLCLQDNFLFPSTAMQSLSCTYPMDEPWSHFSHGCLQHIK